MKRLLSALMVLAFLCAVGLSTAGGCKLPDREEIGKAKGARDGNDYINTDQTGENK